MIDIPMNTALWQPTPAQVRQTRAWLAEHPGADDAAAAAEVCRRWPALAEWEAEWVVEEARAAGSAPAPEPVAVPCTETALPALVEPRTGVRPPARRRRSQARSMDEERAKTARVREEAAEADEAAAARVARRLARDARVAEEERLKAMRAERRREQAAERERRGAEAAAARAARPVKPKKVIVPQPMRGLDGVPEAIHGVPRWRGQPVRASRIPRHLLPEALRGDDVSGAMLYVLRALYDARQAEKPLRIDDLTQLAALKVIEAALTELRRRGWMRQRLVTDFMHSNGRPGCPYIDLSRQLTDDGAELAAQLPWALVYPSGAGRVVADIADMRLIEALMTAWRRGGYRQLVVSDIRRMPGQSQPRDALARLVVCGVLEPVADRARWAFRLTAEVAAAWGLPC